MARNLQGFNNITNYLSILEDVHQSENETILPELPFMPQEFEREDIDQLLW